MQQRQSRSHLGPVVCAAPPCPQAHWPLCRAHQDSLIRGEWLAAAVGELIWVQSEQAAAKARLSQVKVLAPCCPPALLLVKLEHWEVCDPRQCVLLGGPPRRWATLAALLWALPLALPAFPAAAIAAWPDQPQHLASHKLPHTVQG